MKFELSEYITALNEHNSWCLLAFSVVNTKLALKRHRLQACQLSNENPLFHISNNSPHPYPLKKKKQIFVAGIIRQRLRKEYIFQGASSRMQGSASSVQRFGTIYRHKLDPICQLLFFSRFRVILGYATLPYFIYFVHALNCMSKYQSVGIEYIIL